jgi:acyl-CoA thioesterase
MEQRSPQTGQSLAEQVAGVLWDQDRASQTLGMELIDVRPGFARIRMAVRRDMTNGHGTCHGGYMFLLADSSFAFACNTHNQKAVAASAEIHFLASAREGDVLTAESTEQFLAGRSGVYDTRVTNQDGQLIALFRGKSATIKGLIIDAGEPPGQSDAASSGIQA